MTNLHAASEWFATGMRSGVRAPRDAHRWQRCVDHRGPDVRSFANEHFGDKQRCVLLLAGAGFDPRTLSIARLLSEAVQGQLKCVLLREHRPKPNAAHLERAEKHIEEVRRLVPATSVSNLEVFEDDGAVGLGRHAAAAVQQIALDGYTDIVVDFSALSVGSSFPVTRLLLETIERRGDGTNLHAMVMARPRTDDRIVPASSGKVGPVHGFKGRFGLEETARAAKLWIPQLRAGHRNALELLQDHIGPDDVVPVLPFPSDDPRVGDRLIEHYAVELESRWTVDARNIVYADEMNPLDFYRTVLRIDDGRHQVFEGTGGSLLLLSPIGSKVLAIGGMMAAIERDLPVMYVEALSYATEFGDQDESISDADLVHVWLIGRDAYPGRSIGEQMS